MPYVNEFKNRTYLYRSNLKANAKTYMTMSKYMKNENHEVAWEEIKILHKECNTVKRRILEGIYIY